MRILPIRPMPEWWPCSGRGYTRSGQYELPKLIALVHLETHCVPELGDLPPLIDELGDLALEKKLGSSCISLRFCPRVLGSCRYTTLLAACSHVVVFPRHVGLSTSTAPFEASLSFSAKSKTLGMYVAIGSSLWFDGRAKRTVQHDIATLYRRSRS